MAKDSLLTDVLTRVADLLQRRLLADERALNVPVRVQVTRQYKLATAPGVKPVWSDPEDTEEILHVHRYVTTPALAEFKLGGTVKMADFEYARVDVGITVPCYREELDAANDFASDYVSKRFVREIQEARSFVAGKKSTPSF